MKGSFVHDGIACHGALQDRAFTQGTIEFTRHAGGKAHDLSIAQLNPFGMRSRKTNQAAPGASVKHTHRRSLFASHQLRHTRGVRSSDPGNQPHLGPGKWHLRRQRSPAPIFLPDKEDIPLPPSPAGCRSCRITGCASHPLPATHRPRRVKLLRNFPRRHARIPCGEERLAKTAPSALSRNARKLLVPQSTAIKAYAPGSSLLTQCNKASGQMPRWA